MFAWFKNMFAKIPAPIVMRKWRIVSRSTGVDYGTFEALDRAGALEAYAQDVAAEQGTSITRCRMLVAEGSYDVIPI